MAPVVTRAAGRAAKRAGKSAAKRAAGRAAPAAKSGPAPAPAPAPARHEETPEPVDVSGEGASTGSGPGTWARAGELSGRVVGARAPQPIETGAGFLLGVVMWAVALNWLRGGPAQARGWIMAKLVNKPYDGAGLNSHTVKPAKPSKPGGKG